MENQAIVKANGRGFEWMPIGSELNAEFNEYLDYYLNSMRVKGTRKVLIVEDDPISCKILRGVVGNFDKDISCFWATSEKDALEIVRSTGCQLVITDYFLNGSKTGLDLSNEIRESFPDTGCIIVSSLRRHQFNSLSESASSVPTFFEKPVATEKLKSYLNQYFGG